MITPQQKETLHLYAAIMEEVKSRLHGIEYAVNGGTGLIPPLVREFCFLQLRMICELVAIACLAAHGDISSLNVNKLKKEYSAGTIMNVLENLHPKFYPRPIEQIDQYLIPALQSTENGFLSKAELIALNARCGEILHRGTLKKLLSDIAAIQIDHSEIADAAQKFVYLLGNHAIVSNDAKRTIICTLNARDNEGNVSVFFGEAMLPCQ